MRGIVTHFRVCLQIYIVLLCWKLGDCQSTSVTLPLPSEAYSEGECLSPAAVNIDFNWIIQQRTFYVPIANQFAYRRYAETLLSRPATSDQELDTMCLTVETAQGGGALNLTTVGFDDREFRQTCTPGSQPGRINCFAIGSSAGVNPGKTRATENFIVHWDSRTYFIIVRCVDGFFRDFSLLSTRPTVSHDVYNTILNVTRNLGFDDRRIQTMKYDNCLRSTSGLNLNFSNLNHLQRQTGPFTSSALAAPFPSSSGTSSHQPQQQLNNRQYPALGQQYQNPVQLQQQQQYPIGLGPQQGYPPFPQQPHSGGHGFPPHPFLDPSAYQHQHQPQFI